MSVMCIGYQNGEQCAFQVITNLPMVLWYSCTWAHVSH